MAENITIDGDPVDDIQRFALKLEAVSLRKWSEDPPPAWHKELHRTRRILRKAQERVEYMAHWLLLAGADGIDGFGGRLIEDDSDGTEDWRGDPD